MSLDKTTLETKLEGLTTQRQNLLDQANAVTGAIQLVKQLLEELNSTSIEVDEVKD